MATKWEVLPIPDVNLINSMSENLNITKLLSVLLLVRNIDVSEAKEFLNKSDSAIISPYMFKDMEKAVNSIFDHIDKGSKITVFGDYDADGITATALLVKVLKRIGADVDYYVPQRDVEGYGVSKLSIDAIAEKGTKLIITVDCGITAVAECLYATIKGIDMIITDHHECAEILPDAVAIIDAKNPADTYPHSNLAGVGVALKLAQALLEKIQPYKKTAEDYADIVAIGTVADIVPLIGENRYICSLGIDKLNNKSNKGISTLLEISGADAFIDTTKIGFIIAPRINASGRLSSASHAIELLLSEDTNQINELALMLNNFNTERQKIETEIFNQAEKVYLEKYVNDDVVVLFNDAWHHGVVGIVSSRLTKKYFKTFILISRGIDGKCKGSGRSVEGFSLYNALEHSRDTIISFGGHELAAGVVLEEDRIDDFRKKINDYASDYLSNNTIENILRADCELKGRHLNIDTINELSLLEPYGTKNNKPLFFIRNMKVISAYYVGNNKQHLKMTLLKDGITIDGVAFNCETDNINPGNIISVMGYLEINDFRNNYAPQLRIIDIKGEIDGRTM